MMLGSHLTPIARSYIEQSDVVFAGVSNGMIELWLASMNDDVRSLQPLYREGKSRADTYREMVELMLTEVRAGKKVCGAFYGHPGVFTWPTHKAIQLARREGFRAHMEPGISAEDCLYADLGIDPATYGCQHFEASQFMLYRRSIDTSAYLILWQVGIAGDRSFARFSTSTSHRQLLIELLAREYPLDHPVIVYRAAIIPTEKPHMERITLTQLAGLDVDLHSTVVIPPATELLPDYETRKKLALLEAGAREQ
jgi:uncharacterized protein YabN with tetrapyrrole methylase and pyrophosphatase domain